MRLQEDPDRWLWIFRKTLHRKFPEKLSAVISTCRAISRHTSQIRCRSEGWLMPLHRRSDRYCWLEPVSILTVPTGNCSNLQQSTINMGRGKLSDLEFARVNISIHSAWRACIGRMPRTWQSTQQTCSSISEQDLMTD